MMAISVSHQSIQLSTSHLIPVPGLFTLRQPTVKKTLSPAKQTNWLIATFSIQSWVMACMHHGCHSLLTNISGKQILRLWKQCARLVVCYAIKPTPTLTCTAGVISRQLFIVLLRNGSQAWIKNLLMAKRAYVRLP